MARQLTAHDALGAHAEAELGIDPDELSSPWHAAFASLVAFTVGALLPLLAIALPPPGGAGAGDRRRRRAGAGRSPGAVAARLGHAPWQRQVLRNVVGGLLAMGITYGIGSLVGTAV